MWVTKLLIFPVEIRIFCPKTTKFGPKLAFLVNLGQAMQAYSMPCCGSVGGCGARAVSRKTPIYFIYYFLNWSHQRTLYSHWFLVGQWTICAKYGNIWPKMPKNAYFGPILAVFGPKILIFMGVSKSFGTNITETTWTICLHCFLVRP